MILDRMLGNLISQTIFGAPLARQNLDLILDAQGKLMQKYLKVGWPAQ
jgi:hypothetical protein